MNFGMLKNMVDNLIHSYICPFCSEKNIQEQDIDIIWAAWNIVNIDMHCPSCKKHFLAKTEVLHIDMGNVDVWNMKKLHASLQALQKKMGWNIDFSHDENIQSPELIRDESIVALKKTLSGKKISVSDLFSDESEW